jgi:hypothetical protein
MIAGFGGIVRAQNQQQCFAETRFCIEGRFLDFWRANGGLPVFGFPLSAAQADIVEGREVPIQWFERARLELQPANPSSYAVLLGRVGA